MMTRANRCTVQTTENGYEARFYRTHKMLMAVASSDTEWHADENANATTNRESFRTWVCDHAEEYDILWDPTKAEQAWERKHNTYLTDEEVAEDALTLVALTLERLADKSRYDMMIVSTEVSAITPKESTLGYVEGGRYTKSGAWCVADIELEVKVSINADENNVVVINILYNMEIKSGQICKPKTTIAEWNEMVAKELDLEGIVLEDMIGKEKNIQAVVA